MVFISSDLLDGDKRSGSGRDGEEFSAGRDNTGGTLWVMYGGFSRASSTELSYLRPGGSGVLCTLTGLELRDTPRL